MIRDVIFRVEPAEAGRRLDLYVVDRASTTTRSLATSAIGAGRVLVNGRPCRKGHRVQPGDEVALVEVLEAADWKAVPNPAVKVRVIHEEAALLVVDKPSGMAVHPLDPRETDTLVNGLLAAYPELAAVGPDPLFPAVVHRLDADTSGVMLVARDTQTYTYLRDRFGGRDVAKTYAALACGVLEGPGRLEHCLIHSRPGQHRMRVAEGPRRGRRPLRAVTEYEVRERLERHTLLGVTMRTGVTHQIRCQLAHIGHPLAGDSLYGSREADGPYTGRLFLHAEEISFPDPVTGERRSFRADLPQDLVLGLEPLRSPGA